MHIPTSLGHKHTCRLTDNHGIMVISNFRAPDSLGRRDPPAARVAVDSTTGIFQVQLELEIAALACKLVVHLLTLYVLPACKAEQQLHWPGDPGLGRDGGGRPPAGRESKLSPSHRPAASASAAAALGLAIDCHLFKVGGPGAGPATGGRAGAVGADRDSAARGQGGGGAGPTQAVRTAKSGELDDTCKFFNVRVAALTVRPWTQARQLSHGGPLAREPASGRCQCLSDSTVGPDRAEIEDQSYQYSK